MTQTLTRPPVPSRSTTAAGPAGTTAAPSPWRRALHEITVDDDLLGATVAGHDLHAESPRQLQAQLSVALYDHLHAGQGPERAGRTRRVRSAALEEQLTGAVPHTTSTVGAILHRPPEDQDAHGARVGRVLVEYAGTRIWVPSTSVVDETKWTPGTTVQVRVSARRPALSPGFFLVDGTRPLPPEESGLLRLYVHLTSADAAVAAFGVALRHLGDRDVAYRSKVLSSAALYPRRDALVVYLPCSWDEVPALVETLGSTAGLGDATSLFARRLAPGISVAVEPRDPSRARSGLSFGQHRTIVAAAALIDSRSRATDLDEEIDRQFLAAGIDPHDPARNTDSPELPGSPALPGTPE